MADASFERLLKKNKLSFHWNETDKHWFLRKVNKDGKSMRTHPAVANNRAEAESAALHFIHEKFK